MDLDRMLSLCERNQWHADDLDWSVKPKQLRREDEIAVVQYFTDMAGIELLAGKLFQVQRDPRSDRSDRRDGDCGQQRGGGSSGPGPDGTR